MLFQDVLSKWPMILHGVWLTIALSFVAIALGLVLATAMTALRSLAGNWAGYIVDAYVELMRNTPFLVQLFMIFFGLPQLGIRLNGLEASVLAMTLNLAAYATEIIRAGVDSIHKSQIEAGLALAMTKWQVLKHVILQPAFARVWSALSSQFVLMMLASSICSFVSVQELSGTAAIIEQDTFRSFETYIVVTVLYLVLALSFKLFLNWLGRKLFPQVSGLARLTEAHGEAA